ncbi:hypothetical protein AVEN_221323-2-1, partial [Araneus ventricosus]
RGFIGIKADTEENRQKIINFLKEKRLEFVLSEAQEDRSVKAVVRDLPINIEITEIIQSLEEKGYKIERISQIKIFKEKKPLYLIYLKKQDSFILRRTAKCALGASSAMVNMQPGNAVSTKKLKIQSASFAEKKATWRPGKNARSSQSSKIPQSDTPEKVTLKQQKIRKGRKNR